MRVQQQDLPERGNLPSELQTPVHLHGRRCWMCLPLPARAHAAQAGLRQAQAGQGAGTVLRAARLPRGSKDRELCHEETQEKAQQRQQAVWGRPHQQEWVGACVERRVFTGWAVWNNAGNVWISSCCISFLFPLKCSNPSFYVLCAAFKGHPVGHMMGRGVECESQTTDWSPCSKSCGAGVSTRVTNSNSQCKLVKETRICEVRPCNHMTFKRMKVCSF